MIQMNLEEGLAAKDEGLELVEENNLRWVDWMRMMAKGRIKMYGQVTVDDLRKYADGANWYPASPNAWGAIFRGPEWVELGREKSRVPSNHGRKITVWGLRC